MQEKQKKNNSPEQSGTDPVYDSYDLVCQLSDGFYDG